MTPVQRAVGRPPNDPRLPNGPGEKILRAIGRYHLLTAEQIHRTSGYSRNSESFSAKHLKRLTTHGYLEMGVSKVRGIKATWRLTEKGRRHLLAQGIEVDAKNDHHPPQSLNMEHRLAVNNVLIAFDDLARRDPRFVILEMLNESVLARRPIALTLSTGEKYRYAPDAWIHFAVDGVEDAIAIELDRGTEEQRKWRRKIDAYITMTKTPLYETAFGFHKLLVAAVAAPGDIPPPLRARNLANWTKLELEHLGKPDWSVMFLVAPCDPSCEGPEMLTDPRWVHPGSTDYLPLIGGLT